MIRRVEQGLYLPLKKEIHGFIANGTVTPSKVLLFLVLVPLTWDCKGGKYMQIHSKTSLSSWQCLMSDGIWLLASIILSVSHGVNCY